MTITQADLTACKEYMRVDEDVDDSVVLSLVEYAMDYLAFDNFSTLSPTQKLAVKGLALHAYDHRDDDSSANALPLSTDSRAMARHSLISCSGSISLIA